MSDQAPRPPRNPTFWLRGWGWTVGWIDCNLYGFARQQANTLGFRTFLECRTKAP